MVDRRTIEATVSKEAAQDVSIGDEIELDKLTKTGGIVLGRYNVCHISKSRVEGETVITAEKYVEGEKTE